MKALYFISLFIIFFSSYSQVTTTYILDQNNASAWITDRGFFFNNLVDNRPGYELIPGSDQHILYSSSFWFGGVGTNGQLHMCAQRYLSSGSDQSPGPYSSTNDYTSSAYQQSYTYSLWIVDANTIQYHQNHYSDSGYVIPTQIEFWPGNGDTTAGVAYQLAPYVDVNNNGQYDPSNGDYPKIKGCKAVYIITNDDAEPHGGSQGQKLGIEIHYMIYQKSDQSMYPLTTFVDMKVYNRSSSKIRDFTIGYFADGDLGNPSDDYAGADSTRNLMYYYNADNMDEGNQGFQESPPAFGVVCLNDTMNSSGQFTIGSNDPQNASDYWNVMNGRSILGAPWTDDNGDITNYMFYDSPSIQGGYSSYAMQISAADTRTVMSVKTNDLAPDTSITRTYAIIPAFGDDHIDAVNELFSRVDNLQMNFGNGSYSDCDLALNTDEEKSSSSDPIIYPNPTAGSFQIDNVKEDIYRIEVRNMIGQIVYEKYELNNQSKIILPSTVESGIYNLKIYSSSFESKILPLIVR